jgi:hypothetical protein
MANEFLEDMKRRTEKRAQEQQLARQQLHEECFKLAMADHRIVFDKLKEKYPEADVNVLCVSASNIVGAVAQHMTAAYTSFGD